MRELSVQFANASNSASTALRLNAEVQQLAEEIDRVAQASSFNGVKLLDGPRSRLQTFQVGANATASDQITVSSITNARSSALGAFNGSSTQNAACSSTARHFLRRHRRWRSIDRVAARRLSDTRSLGQRDQLAGHPGLDGAMPTPRLPRVRWRAAGNGAVTRR